MERVSDTGRLLLSDMGRVLMSVVEDEAQTHDTVLRSIKRAYNKRAYGDGANWGQFPNARDRLLLGAAKFALGRNDVHPCVNWFKGVHIEEDGTTCGRVGLRAASLGRAPSGNECHRDLGELSARARRAHEYTVTPARVARGAAPSPRR